MIFKFQNKPIIKIMNNATKKYFFSYNFVLYNTNPKNNDNAIEKGKTNLTASTPKG